MIATANKTIEEKTAVTSISVCIVCRNEADKLGDCLQSVTWADEILVMDLESEDNSAEVAAAYGAQVIRREPFPIVEPLRNELAARVKTPWILALDPDERISPDLAALLQELSQLDEINAIVIPRMNYDLGYAPSHPIQRYEPQLRMYRPKRVAWPNFPNKLPHVPADRKFIIPQDDRYVMLHIRNRNVPEAVERIMRYAPAQAASMLEAGEAFSAKRMVQALWKQTDKEFFRAQAWEDGVPGILRATILVMYKFYVWTALWQLAGSEKTAVDDKFVRRWGRALHFVRRVLGLLGRVYRRIRFWG